MGDGRDWEAIVERTLDGDRDAGELLGSGLFQRAAGAWAALSARLPADDAELRSLGGPWEGVFTRLHGGLAEEARWAKVCYLRKLGDGARWARVAFHLWHRPIVERYCRAFATNGDDVADQASRISSLFIERYTESAIPTFPGYLRRMARTRAMRDAQRARHHLTDSALREVAAPADAEPDREAIRAQELRQLKACLGKLSPRQRELLFLRYGEELTLQAIGALQGRSHQAVFSEVERLLRKISSCMKRAQEPLEKRDDQPAL